MSTATWIVLRCVGCRSWLEVTTQPDEAELRVIEFSRDHARCFHVGYDDNGISSTAFGVRRGRYAEEA